MYAFIKGQVAERRADGVVIETAGGVGYLLLASSQTLARLGAGEQVKLYTHFSVREDAMALYGFATKEEQQMFEKLVSVNGIGPKVALGILSALSVTDLAMAVVTDDASALTRAPGVGKKTAQRIILELKERIGQEQLAGVPQGGSLPQFAGPDGAVNEAVQALLALGYQSAEAARAVNQVRQEGQSVEQMILLALKSLDSGR